MAAEERDMNRDPITDEPGSHPVGTGVGAAGGAVGGAAAGAVGGPVGMVVGGVVGAVVGGLAGKAAAEAVNPTAEEAYWRDNYSREPYYEKGREFDEYAPAYRLGVRGRTQHQNWESAEPSLASEWESTRGDSNLSWQQAQPASRAAWNRVDSGLRSGTYGAGSTSDGTVMGAGPRSSYGSGTGTTSTTEMGSGMDSSYVTSTGASTSSYGSGSTGSTSAAGMVGAAQSAGNNSGDTDDVIDALQNLVECCKDGEYGFRACAEQTQRQDLKSTFLQRADDCRNGAQELNDQIRGLGGKTEDTGSVAGAMHRGWVSVKATFSAYDDQAVLEEAERGEDNAKARYMKALKQPLPANIKLIVERQMQGVQRNHDQIKMLRDQFRASS